MVLDIAGGLFEQRDVRETPSAAATASSTIIAPIGSILPWLKSYTNTPQTLPTGWVECDGSTVSDADSVYDGQALPDLNGGEFIRGATTSGGTGGSGTTSGGSAHTHSITGSVSSHTLIESEMPAHTHTITGSLAAGTGGSRFTTLNSGETPSTNSTGGGGGHTHGDTFAAGNESSHTHTITPVYYNVVWIMRIK